MIPEVCEYDVCVCVCVCVCVSVGEAFRKEFAAN